MTRNVTRLLRSVPRFFALLENDRDYALGDRDYALGDSYRLFRRLRLSDILHVKTKNGVPRGMPFYCFRRLK